MEDLLITMGVAVILQSIKNPNKKASLRKAMLKVFSAIRAAYAGDPAFE